MLEDIIDVRKIRREKLESGKTKGLGKLLADKALESLFGYGNDDDNSVFEEALGFPETRRYVDRHLGSFALRFAKCLKDFANSGEEFCTYRAATVLKGKNAKKIVSQLNPRYKAFNVLQEQVVYSALYSYLLYASPDVRNVNDFLNDKDYQALISPECTRKTVEEYADQMMDDLDFKTLELRVNSKDFGHLFSEELKAKIAERKEIAYGRRKGKGQTRIPLYGIEYSRARSAEFRKEVDYAIDVAINKSTDFSMLDLLRNVQFRNYIADPGNRNDFMLKFAHAARTHLDNVINNTVRTMTRNFCNAIGIDASELSKEADENLKLSLICQSIGMIRLYAASEDFVNLVASRCRKSPAISMIGELLYKELEYGLKCEAWNHTIGPFVSDFKHRETGGTSLYLSEKGVRKVFETHLLELIANGNTKEIHERFRHPNFTEHYPATETDKVLKQAVASGNLSKEQYNEMCAE